MPRKREGSVLSRAMSRLLEQQESSGLSVAEYARQQGLDPGRLYEWRRRLGWSGGRRRKGAARIRRREPESAVTLIPVEVEPVVASPFRPEAVAASVILELPTGERIHVPPGIGEDALVATVRALRRCC